MPQLPTSPRADNATQGQQVSNKLTFFGMVGGVMAALKFKERWDTCELYLSFVIAAKITSIVDKQVPASDEEAGLLGDSPPSYRDVDEDDAVTLRSTNLDTGIPGAARPKRVRKKGCCMCCGIEFVFFLFDS